MIRLNLSSLETEAVGRAADYLLDADPAPDPATWGRDRDHVTDRHMAALVRVIRKIEAVGKASRRQAAPATPEDDEMGALVSLAEARIRALWAETPPGPDRARQVARLVRLHPQDVAEVAAVLYPDLPAVPRGEPL
jgi:hypothetical protein